MAMEARSGWGESGGKGWQGMGLAEQGCQERGEPGGQRAGRGRGHQAARLAEGTRGGGRSAARGRERGQFTPCPALGSIVRALPRPDAPSLARRSSVRGVEEARLAGGQRALPVPGGVRRRPGSAPRLPHGLAADSLPARLRRHILPPPPPATAAAQPRLLGPLR